MYRKTGQIGAALVLTTGMCIGGGEAQELPDTLIWSTYDVGSSGYSQAAAIADAFGKEYNTRIRILPASNEIGRIDPVLEGKADLGFLASEVFFASEGIYAFGTPDRGPKVVRLLAGRVAAFGLSTAADANVRTIADLAGKRVAVPVGNFSAISKCEAALAFGGLSWDDVVRIDSPSYADSLRSVAENRSDAVCSNPAAPPLYAQAEGARDIHWMEFPPDDTEGWARLQALLPGMSPLKYDVVAGLEEGESIWLPGYRYPQIAVRSDMSDDEAYAITKAFDMAYPRFKDAIKGMELWSMDQAGVPPMDAPMHSGAIQYMKEKGYWTDDAETWQRNRLAREAAVIAAWKAFLPGNRDLPSEEFSAAWEKARAKTKLD